MIVFLIGTLGPNIWCLIISLSPETEMFGREIRLLPQNPTIANYAKLLDLGSRQSQSVLRGMGNSMKAVAATLALGLPVSLITAFALSRLEFRFKSLIRTSLLVTIVIPVFTTIIPLYSMFASFRILDNIFWLSAVYVSSFLPMMTWILSNYMEAIPRELDESACLDGCGPIGVFIRIILPNCIPIVLAVVLMMFLMTWSQYQIPLILASSIETKPLSMIVAEFTSKDMVQYGITAAAGILAIFPPLIVALAFRQSLLLGMTQGAVKG